MDLTRSLRFQSARCTTWCVALAAAAGLLMVGPARAGDIYLSTIVELSPNSTNFHLIKHGKIKIVPSVLPGNGGLTTLLALSNVDCPPPGPGNDKDVAGKCGAKGSPVTNHVLAVSASSFGLDLKDVVGIRYKIELGKVAFQATGKNVIGGAAFGPLVSAIFNQPLGIGFLKLHQAGSVPTDCDKIPLPINTCKGGTNAGAGCNVNGDCNSNVCSPNGCTDGPIYAEAGIVAGSDPGVTCSGNGDCAVTQVCTGSQCVAETCTVDADCDQGGGVGSHQCGSNGQCCDPTIDPTCAGQVP